MTARARQDNALVKVNPHPPQPGTGWGLVGHLKNRLAKY